MTDPINTSHKQDKPASLGRSGSVVAVMTLLSRVLGFVRDQVLAIVFGAGATTDVFLVAFKIPNFLRRLFAEGAFAQAFIPVFTEYREKGDRESLKELAAHVSGTLTVVLLIITTLGVMFAPFIVMVFAPGFIGNDEQFELATHNLIGCLLGQHFEHLRAIWHSFIHTGVTQYLHDRRCPVCLSTV